ncbi:hypothetical protein [Sphingomonas aerophila]|uniref:Lipoprotein n=1 Tax=Sphingomonas aerophila TaxID=1344948 RepID=A0A7W9EUB4_9SPHN|nr:hypothetical protein [Sphingomonas aerophila]MBB5714995.1 hypothetical protein [Sphingomonas aerophila]
MRRAALLLPVITGALLAGCAALPADTARAQQAQQATADSLQRRLAGLTPGPPQACLPLNILPSSGVQTKGYGSTILYVVGRDLIYRNDTTGGCERIAQSDILVTRQLQGRACRGDIATTVDPASRMQTGSCAFGDFVPYRRAK